MKSENSRRIAVFAYSFTHKKTYDFLTFLKAKGFNNVCVIAAPKVNLEMTQDRKFFSTLPSSFPDINCEELCLQLGYKYLESKHSDVNMIRDFLLKHECLDLGVVSGARILNAEIISIFKQGIINFHPGKIPETSGLDSFYWMMKNQSSPGCTVHFIDHKVDAGELIFFHECKIDIEDTPQTVHAKLYNSQLDAFKRLLNLLSAQPELKTEKIIRPSKNRPLDDDEKKETLVNFNEWKKNTVLNQSKVSECFNACEVGDIEWLEKHFKPNLLNIVNNKGWTPLIVAAFNQHLNCAEFLIKKGADVNGTNDKGTTVLMYAKTSLVNRKNPSLNLLKLLIFNGANRYKKDLFNKNIFDYIEQLGDIRLSKMIKDI